MLLNRDVTIKWGRVRGWVGGGLRFVCLLCSLCRCVCLQTNEQEKTKRNTQQKTVIGLNRSSMLCISSHPTSPYQPEPARSRKTCERKHNSWTQFKFVICAHAYNHEIHKIKLNSSLSMSMSLWPRLRTFLAFWCTLCLCVCAGTCRDATQNRRGVNCQVLQWKHRPFCQRATTIRISPASAFAEPSRAERTAKTWTWTSVREANKRATWNCFAKKECGECGTRVTVGLFQFVLYALCLVSISCGPNSSNGKLWSETRREEKKRERQRRRRRRRGRKAKNKYKKGIAQNLVSRYIVRPNDALDDHVHVSFPHRPLSTQSNRFKRVTNVILCLFFYCA